MLIERVLTLLREQTDSAATNTATHSDAGVRVAQVAEALQITPQQAVSALHLLVRKKNARRVGNKPYRYLVAPPAADPAPLPPLPPPADWTPPPVLAPVLVNRPPGKRVR